MSQLLSPEIFSSITAANSVYVLLGTRQTADTVGSALALAQGIKSLGKTVFIASPKAITGVYAQFEGASQVAQEIGNRNLIITLALTNTDDIDKISYNVNEEEKTFNLVVQPRNDAQPIGSDNVKFSYSGAQADVVLIVGAASTQELGFFYEQEKKLFESTTTIALSPAFSQKFATHTHELNQGESIAQISKNMLEQLQVSIDAVMATNLLAGIDEVTNKLQSPATTPEMFEAVGSLIRSGGKRMFDMPSLNQKPVTQAPTPTAQPQPAVDALKSTTSNPQENGAKSQESSNKSEIQVPQDWLKQPKIYKGGRDAGGKK
jgi:hypothetical protein